MQAKYNRNLVSRQRRGSLAFYVLMNPSNPAKEFTAFRRRNSRFCDQTRHLQSHCWSLFETVSHWLQVPISNVRKCRRTEDWFTPERPAGLSRNGKEKQGDRFAMFLKQLWHERQGVCVIDSSSLRRFLAAIRSYMLHTPTLQREIV